MLRQIRSLIRRRYLSLPAVLLAAVCATASAQAATLVLDFDSVDTGTASSYVNVDATAYFASYGITLTNNTPSLSPVNIINYGAVYGGTALVPVSSPNLLEQSDSLDPVGFTLTFSSPLISFGFTVPDDLAPSAFPSWQAFAYAGLTQVASASGGGCCFSGPSIYTLNGPGITSVTINSQNGHFAAFGGVPLDNLVLTTSEPSVTPVSIDIKPGSFPNSINPKSQGVIPVAILTTDTFDATTVDPLSVEFGPNGAVEAHGRGHIEDANGDGDLDLVLHFRTQDTGIQCGDTSASLTGETLSGQVIEGSDSIKTVGCK